MNSHETCHSLNVSIIFLPTTHPPFKDEILTCVYAELKERGGLSNCVSLNLIVHNLELRHLITFYYHKVLNSL